MLNWKFIDGYGSLLERGMRRAATLGALQMKRELRLADEVPAVIPSRALNYFRINSFQIAHVENQVLLDQVKEKLADALRGGGTLADFKRDLPALFDAAGVTPLHNFHTETVFRSNLHRAYLGGRMIAFNASSPEQFPYIQTHTAGDDKVRARHKPLNNKIFRRDDPDLQYVWEILNEYNCRCNWTAISIYEAQDEGLEPTPKDELLLPGRLEGNYDPDSSMLFNQYDWWQEKMGKDWAATPQTYGLGEMASAPINSWQHQGMAVSNFEGVSVAVGSGIRESAGGEYIDDIINSPAEVWSVPGSSINMRYLKRSGSDVYLVEVTDAGAQTIRKLTPAQAEEWRRGVLVYLR